MPSAWKLQLICSERFVVSSAYTSRHRYHDLSTRHASVLAIHNGIYILPIALQFTPQLRTNLATNTPTVSTTTNLNNEPNSTQQLAPTLVSSSRLPLLHQPSLPLAGLSCRGPCSSLQCCGWRCEPCECWGRRCS